MRSSLVNGKSLLATPFVVPEVGSLRAVAVAVRAQPARLNGDCMITSRSGSSTKIMVAETRGSDHGVRIREFSVVGRETTIWEGLS